MKIKLRTYQEELKKLTRNAFENYNKVILLAPCGSGKTVISTSILQDSINKSKIVWFVVHREELLEQAQNTLKKYNVQGCKVYMVQSLYNKLNKINEIPDMIVFDECHHASSSTYRKIIDYYPCTFILGLTATATRLSGKPLGDIFEKIVTKVQASELIKMGFLADYDYYAPKLSVDFSSIKIRQGDYVTNEIEEALDNTKIYGDILKNYRKYCIGRKTIIYCATIDYSRKIQKLFTDNGFIIEHFDSKTNKIKRKKIVEDFRSNKIDILTNVELVGEGFDVPDCDCCILLRPTQSLTLYIQQATRCLRPKGGQKAIVLDFVNNCYRHGMPTEDRIYSLEETIKCNNKHGEPDINVRECSNCYKCYKGTDRICPYCGHDNGKTRKEQEEEKRAELEKITKIEKNKIKREQGMARDFKSLVALGKSRGYAKPTAWAAMIIKSRKKKEKI